MQFYSLYPFFNSAKRRKGRRKSKGEGGDTTGDEGMSVDMSVQTDPIDTDGVEDEEGDGEEASGSSQRGGKRRGRWRRGGISQYRGDGDGTDEGTAEEDEDVQEEGKPEVRKLKINADDGGVLSDGQLRTESGHFTVIDYDYTPK